MQRGSSLGLLTEGEFARWANNVDPRYKLQVVQLIVGYLCTIFFLHWIRTTHGRVELFAESLHRGCLLSGTELFEWSISPNFSKILFVRLFCFFLYINILQAFCRSFRAFSDGSFTEGFLVYGKISESVWT